MHAVLSKYVELDKAWFIERASRNDDPYEEVARHIDADVAEKVRALQVPGVQLFREQWRYYPGGTLGAHTLGFVGYGEGGDTLKGQYGIERYWDSYLNREDDHLYVNFFAEIFANVRAVSRRNPELFRRSSNE